MSIGNLPVRLVRPLSILVFVIFLPVLGWAQKPIDPPSTEPQYVNRHVPPTDAQIGAWHCEAQVFDLSTVPAAYRSLFQAVKCKNTEHIKGALSRTTIEFMTAAAGMQKKSLEEVLVNGTMESNLSNTLPIPCQERVKDTWGALEIKGDSGKWEDVPYVLEDGKWKVAVGDIFKGTYQKPSDTICTPPPDPDPPPPPPGIFGIRYRNIDGGVTDIKQAAKIPTNGRQRH